jgi:GalNAc-alpha-(1->4)-GalNAc-alpha-(1->3)-diNAcBac-PP-undecaprenol alpha-1,4-N-acetyl-D-galactosaminyltransferase
MKVLLTTASLQGGGAERVLTWLAGSLLDRGHEVTLITLMSPDSDFYSLPPGVKREVHKRGKQWRRDSLRIRRLFFLSLLRKHSRSADVVVSFLTTINAATLIATFGLKTPVIISERSAKTSGGCENRDEHIIRRLAPRGAYCLVVQSEQIADQFQGEWGLPQCVIPNAYLPSVSSASTQLRSNVVLSVGRLVEVKNHASLIRAWAIICLNNPDWVLRIVGDGPLRESLEDLSWSLMIRDRVELIAATHEIGMEYDRASIFVFPSLKEGFPNALLEAAGNGLPCIATDCPGASSEILEHGKAGILVPVNDDLALAEELQRLISDPVLRNSFSERAKESVQRFSAKEIADKWESLLLGATNGQFNDSTNPKSAR